MSGVIIPPDVAAATPAGMVAVKDLTVTMTVQQRAEREGRSPTPDEVASTFRFEPFNPKSPRHVEYANAAAQAKAEAARRAAGVKPDAPPTSKMEPLTFAGICALVEHTAERLNADKAADERGVVVKYATRPDRLALLACRLAGGSVAPTQDEIMHTLETLQHLRVSVPGDIPMPKGGAQ